MELVVAGSPVQLDVRRSARARRLRLTVTPGRDPIVTVPARTSKRALLRFVSANAGWLAERLAEAGDATARARGLALVGAPASERWYRAEARRRIEASVAQHAAALDIPYARIAIRDQRTRWGSCSTSGTLSFNWRLVVAPERVLDYVVVHELLHVREPNHSKAFWGLLDRHRPAWRDEAAWLRAHGDVLLAFDPES